MSHSENEIKALNAEIQHVSPKKKLLARPTLEVILQLIEHSPGISPVEFLRQYLAHLKAAEGLLKVFYPIFVV